jgi:hypothetical protein
LRWGIPVRDKVHEPELSFDHTDDWFHGNGLSATGERLKTLLVPITQDPFRKVKKK